MIKFLDNTGLAYFWEKIKSFVPSLSKKSQSIPFGQVDSTSTSTAFTATIDGITELRDGVCCYLRNGVVSSASGCTLNINNLGALPIYNTWNGSRSSTAFSSSRTYFFIYNSSRVDGGCWDLYVGDYSDSDVTGYNVCQYYHSKKPKTILYRYQFLFTCMDGLLLPVNTVNKSVATNKELTTESFDVFGEVYYYGTTKIIQPNASIVTGNLWSQAAYTLCDLRYSFNTGETLIAENDVYLVCSPQPDGSVKLAEDPIAFALPNTEDGLLYKRLGKCYDTYRIILEQHKPVYYYKDGAIRLWTNQAVQDVSNKADKVVGATNGNFAGLDANGNLTDSGHKHGDYVTALGTSENYVTWTKNGTANNLTVPYSTSASRLNITALSTGADMNDYTAEGVYGTTTTSVCASFVNAPEGRSNGEMRLEVIGCVNNGAYLFQRYWARSSSGWQLYIRTKSGTGWSSWVKNLDSSNGVSKVTSTDNAVVRFDGTEGSIQNSGVIINDSNHITAAKFITSGGTSSQFVKGDGSLDSNTYATTASLESYLPLAGGTMTGSIRRDYDSASDVPALNILSNNQDVWLWRVKDKATGAATATSSVYGFGLKYLGTGEGNNNSLALYSDNQGGTQVKAVEMKQDGTIEFSKAITAPTAAAGTNTTQLATTAFVQSAVNNNSYCANLQTTATSTYNTIPEVQKIKINGDSTLTAASTENCEMVYDKTNKCLKFVFN